MDDDLHGNNGGMHNGGGVQDSNHSMHVQYDHHGMMDEQHADDVMNEGLEADIPSHLGNTSDHRGEVVDRGSENGDQLTLSFQGQVYVFDRVLPEKVTSNPSSNLRLFAGLVMVFFCVIKLSLIFFFTAGSSCAFVTWRKGSTKYSPDNRRITSSEQ